MKTFLKLCSLSILPLLALVARPAAAQIVTVIDMIPNSLSAESNRDAEPNLTVDPAHPQKMAATAFTPDPGNSQDGVLFLSKDGGSHWSLTPPVLSGSGSGPSGGSWRARCRSRRRARARTGRRPGRCA